MESFILVSQSAQFSHYAALLIYIHTYIASYTHIYIAIHTYIVMLCSIPTYVGMS